MVSRGYTDPGTRRVSYYDPDISTDFGTNMWKTCPLLEWLFDPMVGHHLFVDFHSASKSSEDWILTQATAGTGVAGVLAGGVFTLNAGAVTDGQGPQIQLAGVDFFPVANKPIWFECRLKVSHITGDFFFGLAELDTTIVASSDMTTSNHIGFSSFTGDGILLRDADKATVRVNTGALKTLVAATYVRLGFYCDGVTTIQFYVDGVAVGSTVATASIPVVGLTPSFTVHATGTDQAVVDLDYVKIFQLR